MTAAAALREGIRRVASAPVLLAGVWLMTLALSVPLALVMRGMLADHLGASMAADRAASGVDYEWMQEFADPATGIGVTFRPTIIGFGAVLDNTSGFADAVSRPTVMIGAAAAYIVLWVFVAGGILDRLARNRPIRAHGFFAASGVFFVRFLRLGVLQAIVYGLLFGPVHRALFADAFSTLTRDTTVERTAFGVRLAFYVVFGLLVALFNLAFDYAKVRAVVEDRRSMAGAFAGAVRFVRMNPAAVALYVLDLVLFVFVVALYGLVAPGAGGAGLSMWVSFLVGELYIAARLWVKLVFWAGETALFQSRLAHAGYIASPMPVWPESPAAEAIVRES
jgi:hypothetical protein